MRSVLQPWRAYLARYPEVPLVVVIGDDSDDKFFQPQPGDLAEIPSLTLVHTGEIDLHRGKPLKMVAYERCDVRRATV